MNIDTPIYAEYFSVPPATWTPESLKRTVAAQHIYHGNLNFYAPAFIYTRPRSAEISNHLPFDPPDPDSYFFSVEPWNFTAPYAEEYKQIRENENGETYAVQCKMKWGWSVTSTFTMLKNSGNYPTTTVTKVAQLLPSTVTIETDATQTQTWTWGQNYRTMNSTMGANRFNAPTPWVMLAQQFTYFTTVTGRPNNSIVTEDTVVVSPTENGLISYISVNNGLNGLRSFADEDGGSPQATLGKPITNYQIQAASRIDVSIKPYYIDIRKGNYPPRYGLLQPLNWSGERPYYDMESYSAGSAVQVHIDRFPETTTTSQIDYGEGETYDATYAIYTMAPTKPVITVTNVQQGEPYLEDILVRYNHFITEGGVAVSRWLPFHNRQGYTNTPAADNGVPRAMASQHTSYSIENCQITIALDYDDFYFTTTNHRARIFAGLASYANGIITPAYLPTWTGYAKLESVTIDDQGYSYTYWDTVSSNWSTVSISRRGAALSSSWSWGNTSSSATGLIVFNGTRQPPEPVQTNYANVFVYGGRVHPHSTITQIVTPGIELYQTFDHSAKGVVQTTRRNNWGDATWETTQVNSTITVVSHIPWVIGIGAYLTPVDHALLEYDNSNEQGAYWTGQGNILISSPHVVD